MSKGNIVQCRGCPRKLTYKYVEWREGMMLCATCAAKRGDCDSCGQRTSQLLHTCSSFGCGEFCPNCDGRKGVA